MTESKIYDYVIIGGGSAGLAAAIYAGRARMDVLLIEGTIPGGEAARTDIIENYPGFPEAVNGPRLMELFKKQAEKFGAKFDTGEISKIEINGEIKILTKTDGSKLKAYAVLIATGTSHLHLNVPGEKEFAGRGVSYCATCDGAFFRDVPIAVIGGGDSALDEGLFLTRFGKKVYIIHRRDELRATKILQERAFADPKVEVVFDTVVEEIYGDKLVKGLRLKNVKTGEKSELAVEGVFIFVGSKPNSEFVKGLVETDERGNIITNLMMETNVKGVYAAGDVRISSYRQVGTAVGDGITAAIAAEKYVSQIRFGKSQPAR
ncbi:MAG: thioredoxin-disulfide reductase [Myxococcota bacterium]